jgi:hypothetical protein
MRPKTTLLTIAFTLASLPAFAQRPDGAGETLQSLSAKLAALTERVAKLESGRVDAADLVGTYIWAYLGVQLQGNPARIDLESVDSDQTRFTLNADGTAAVSVGALDCQLQEGAPWVVLPCESESGQGTATWHVNGAKLIIDFPDGDQFELDITAGGRVLASSGAVSNQQFGYAFANIGLLVKLPTQ